MERTVSARLIVALAMLVLGTSAEPKAVAGAEQSDPPSCAFQKVGIIGQLATIDAQAEERAREPKVDSSGMWLGLLLGGHSTTVLTHDRRISTGLIGTVILGLGRPDVVNTYLSFVYWEARTPALWSPYYEQPSNLVRARSFEFGLRFPLTLVATGFLISISPSAGIGGSSDVQGTMVSVSVSVIADWIPTRSVIRFTASGGFRAGGQLMVEGGSSHSFVFLSLGLGLNVSDLAR